MADYNNNSRLPLLVEKRLLALAALEVVRRHDVLRMTELNSHVLELTSELAIVRNERDESRAEMDRLCIIIHGRDRLSNRPGPEGAVGVQGAKIWLSMIRDLILGWKTVTQPMTYLLWQ